jgi:DNA polymerase V
MKPYQGDETTGFQSPAQDYVEPVLDLPRLLDLRRPGLYPVRVIGHDLNARGIYHGDILIANAADEPAAGRVCVAFLQGEVILATLIREEDAWLLKPASRAPIPVTEDVEIWAIINSLVRLNV